MKAQISHCDADGKTTSQSSYGRYANDWERQVVLRDQGGLSLGGQVHIALDGTGPLNLGATTTYTGFNAEGNVTAYHYTQQAQAVFNASALAANHGSPCTGKCSSCRSEYRRRPGGRIAIPGNKKGRRLPASPILVGGTGFEPVTPAV